MKTKTEKIKRSIKFLFHWLSGHFSTPVVSSQKI